MQAITAYRPISFRAVGRATAFTPARLLWASPAPRLAGLPVPRASYGNGMGYPRADGSGAPQNPQYPQTAAGSSPPNPKQGMYYSSPPQPPPQQASQPPQPPQQQPPQPSPQQQQSYYYQQPNTQLPYNQQPSTQQPYTQQPYTEQNYAPAPPPGVYPAYGPGLSQQQQQPAYPPAAPSAYPPAGPPAYQPYSGPPPAAPPPVALERVNPGRQFVNAVSLLGAVGAPFEQGQRYVRSMMLVPFATKVGAQEFQVEAWDAQAAQLRSAAGSQVLVEGRLALDKKGGTAKVVVRSIKLVDTSAPPSTQISGAAAAVRPRGPALDGKEVYRMHYETKTQTLQALAAHFGREPRRLRDVLLGFAFETTSPLHFRPLAEEAGLATGDGGGSLTLADLMALVAEYRRDVDRMQAAAQPGAEPPPLPVRKNGMPSLRPIREWALSRGPEDDYCTTITMFESQTGVDHMYAALQLAVVADATRGTWDYGVEFGAQS